MEEYNRLKKNLDQLRSKNDEIYQSQVPEKKPSKVAEYFRKGLDEVKLRVSNRYYAAIKDPTQLPGLLQPFISDAADYTYETTRSSKIDGSIVFRPALMHEEYKPTGHFYRFINVENENGESKRLVFKLQISNLVLGCIGSTAVMSVCQDVGVLHHTNRFLYGSKNSPTFPPASTNVLYSKSQVMMRILSSSSRVMLGAVLYDFVRRNIDKRGKHSPTRNGAVAGFLCGALIGSRGGVAGSLVGSALFSLAAGWWESKNLIVQQRY